MRGIFLWLAACGLAACQTSGTARDPGSEMAGKSSSAKGLSGLYLYQFQAKNNDGKGKPQNEFGRFSYALDEVTPGNAAVRYEGEATYASRSSFGGTDSAWIRVSGMAVLKQGVWVLTTTAGGNCEVRFQADGQNLRHVSAICQQPGQFGHYAWPPAQTSIKFVRSLQPAEQAELRSLRKPH